MAGPSATDDEDAISGINVTPLVDVVLVLLIIFLITAPVLQQQSIKVNLPSAKSGQDAPKAPINLTITREGNIIWEKATLDAEGLRKELANGATSFARETAVISADENVPNGKVIRVLDILRIAGLTKIAFSVKKP